MEQEKVIVIDFGGQYNQLVARRVRENNVYCEIYSYRTDLQKIKEMNPKGIILTGGPNSVYEEGAATCSRELFELGMDEYLGGDGIALVEWPERCPDAVPEECLVIRIKAEGENTRRITEEYRGGSGKILLE